MFIKPRENLFDGDDEIEELLELESDAESYCISENEEELINLDEKYLKKNSHNLIYNKNMIN